MATYNPGLDPRPYNQLSPQEQAIRSGTSQPLRNLQLESGDPAAILANSRTAAGAVGDSTPTSAFNAALMDLLKQYQTLGTKSFQEQGLNAQEEQNRRISAETPQNLIGASPGLQASARGASAGALDPTIQGARQNQQTYSEQLRSLGDALTTTRQFFNDLQTQENKKRDDARALIKDSFSIFGGGALDKASDDEVARLEKEAGLPKGYIKGVGSTLKERELEQKRQQRALTGGLTANQINSTINQIAGAFDNEPTVKNYNTIAEQVNFVKSLGQTPTDDQARIYAFAKVMDPNSTVREGEYKTVQEYSQALLKKYGIQAKRVFTNSGLLTPEARTFLQDTLSKRLSSYKIQYDNVANEYQRQIDDARAGNPRKITNYGGAFPSSQPSGQTPASTGTKYKSGSVIKSGNTLYLVGDDGTTVTPIGSAQ